MISCRTVREKNSAPLTDKHLSMRIIVCGAQKCAAHRLHRLTRQRPAPITNRKCRPGVGKATGARCPRDGVTGSAYTEATYPSLALGLSSTEDGSQMEKVIPISPCRSFAYAILCFNLGRALGRSA